MVSITSNNRKYCLAILCLLALATTMTSVTSTSTGGLRTVSSPRHNNNHNGDTAVAVRDLQQKQFGNPNQVLPKPTKTKRPTKKPTKRPTKRPTKKPVSNQIQEAELCTISTGCLASQNNNLNFMLPGQVCPTACIEVWDPVCDCVGKQHSNVCAAHSVGVSVVKRVNPNTGEC